jgi:hypothetical protein
MAKPFPLREPDCDGVRRQYFYRRAVYRRSGACGCLLVLLMVAANRFGGKINVSEAYPVLRRVPSFISAPPSVWL